MPHQALRPKLLGALSPTLALLLALGLADAHALGLGPPQIHSSLGHPLDASFALILADGEQLREACLRAEVSAGEFRVPAGLLQMRVEGEPGQQRVRLQSQVRIEEPALRITLALGCPTRLTREFNAFVDPAPGAVTAVAAPPPPPPTLPPAEPMVRLQVQPPARPAAAGEGGGAAAPSKLAAAPGAREPRPARPLVVAAPVKAKPTGPRLVLERPAVLAQVPTQGVAKPDDAELTPELEATIAQLERTVAALRAELQARQAASAVAVTAVAPEPAAPASTVAAVASAASAAPAQPASQPASAPTPAPAPMPAATAARTSPYRDPMTWVLTLAASLLAGALAFYWSRWRDLRAQRERAYWRALHAGESARPVATRVNAKSKANAKPAAPVPSVPPVSVPATAPMPAVDAPSAGMAPPVLSAAAALPDEGQYTATQPIPRPMSWPAAGPDGAEQLTTPGVLQAPAQPQPQTPTLAAPRVTSADELLDLQQQVDFLQLLGQHDAAADLLTACLTRGGAGAMPHLMLMELCQQRGEPNLFAELAQQYERRFGRLAPDWSQSLARGRTLDACPSVIAHLQVVWNDPQAALAMLQELIANGAGPGVPSFDLPSYRDLLSLYGVARDLFETSQRSDDVDLMLPLDSQFDGNF